jgi:hypothetical protein
VTENAEPAVPPQGEESAEVDLARRLARYRRRVAAEGRPKSLKLIDRAIDDADKKASQSG